MQGVARADFAKRELRLEFTLTTTADGEELLNFVRLMLPFLATLESRPPKEE